MQQRTPVAVAMNMPDPVHENKMDVDTPVKPSSTTFSRRKGMTATELLNLTDQQIGNFPTNIGILLTYPKLEATKEELVSASRKRPWAFQAYKAVSPEGSPQYVCQRTGETTGKKGKGIPTDVSIGYYIRRKFGRFGVNVDLILPHEITKERLAKNDLNFFLIYDLLEAFHTDKTPGKKYYQAVKETLENADNIYPPMSYQKLINSKIKYYRWLKKNKINIVPTRTMTASAFKKMGSTKATEHILAVIKKQGWYKFVAKPVFGQESIDLQFFTVNAKTRFRKYLEKSMDKYLGIIFQKYIPGFGDTKKSPEVRMYHVGDDYKYSIISTSRKVHTPFEEGGSLKKLPMDGLRKQAEHIMNKLPKLEVQGQVLPRLLTRLDLGCYVDDKFKPFVNEIEFVPSLYIEDHKHVIEDQLGEQMVRITRTLLNRGRNDMEHLMTTFDRLY